MIEVKDLSVQTRGFTLKDISLTIETGSCHLLIGPTGCGKTTLMEAILGLRRFQKGMVLLEGRNITNLPVHQRGFSYVPQDLAIFPHLTVEENILYGIRHGLASNSRYENIKGLVDVLGISHLLKRKTMNLSTGERQRVAFARALAPGYKYLMLDEPFTGLHEGMKKDLWFLLKQLQKRYDLTILMISHDLAEAFFLADYISVMIDGTIHETNRKDEVYSYPCDLEVARFFGIKNIFEAEIIGMERGHLKTYSRVLNAEIILPTERIKAQLQQQTKITFGIRSEDVMILRPDLPMRKENLLTGIIRDVYPAGSVSIVLFQPDNSEQIIEITMPEYAISKLSIKPMKPVTITLRSERLFVVV